MISGMGAALIGAYIIGLITFLIRGDMFKYRWIMLNASIIINIFWAFGTSIFGLSYINLAMFLYDFTAVMYFVLESKKIRIKKALKNKFVLLYAVITASLINLLINENMPEVILMNTSMDSVYYGTGQVSRAVWTKSNPAALRDFSLMIIGIILSNDLLLKDDYANKLIKNVKISFHVFFCIATVEFIINNIMSPALLRNIVYNIIGDFNRSKTWTAENRFGYYGVTALFPEQSYISVILIYYAIMYKIRIRTTKDVIFFMYSILVLFMFGCTTSLMILPFGLFIYIRDTIVYTDKKIRISTFYQWIALVAAVIGAIIILNRNTQIRTELLLTTEMKISAFVEGGKYSTSLESSGAIRNYGNSIAIRAFLQSPLFGVGIGTTRGYGIIVGLLANFGLFGVFAYILYLQSSFNLSIKRNVLLLIILIGYFSITLNVGYAYYFAMIPVYLLFRKNDVFGAKKHDS